ncbi:MAG TPA: hypothetical protein VGS57_20810 [Thermoanaerobaculia bacterium]|jgi:hypothetical protein|nr:hypothetical protein [Thermoanaerobaculia bacterium]
MAARAFGVDDEIRALYHGPFAEFTTARNALAKRLKKDGDARQTEVKELKKPSLSAWAVDQLFAKEARAMAAFVGAGERARAAQRKAAAGGDPKPLRELLATIRGEVTRLTGRGIELLAETEKAPGEAIVERLRTNLEALALDPDAAPVAARGWLDEDLKPPGFEIMAALQVAASRGAPSRAVGGTAAAPAGRPRSTASVPARPSLHDDADQTAATRAKKPLATVHRLDDARTAATERRERPARDFRERERRVQRDRLAAELARAEREAQERRTAAERAEVDAADAERRAAEARARAQKAAELTKAAEAAVAAARRALAEFE